MSRCICRWTNLTWATPTAQCKRGLLNFVSMRQGMQQAEARLQADPEAVQEVTAADALQGAAGHLRQAVQAGAQGAHHIRPPRCALLVPVLASLALSTQSALHSENAL